MNDLLIFYTFIFCNLLMTFWIMLKTTSNHFNAIYFILAQLDCFIKFDFFFFFLIYWFLFSKGNPVIYTTQSLKKWITKVWECSLSSPECAISIKTQHFCVLYTLKRPYFRGWLVTMGFAGVYFWINETTVTVSEMTGFRSKFHFIYHPC